MSKDKKTLISSSSFFNGLSLDHIDHLSAIAIEKNYSRGQTIFFEGDPGVGFYMVWDGKVKIYKVSPAGKEHILHIFGPGEPYGEVPVFYGMPFPAHAEALTKGRSLFFPRENFVHLVESHPSIALSMLAVLSLRLRKFTGQIESLSLKEVPARLANYLVYLSEEQDNTAEVILDISKGQLASLLGTIPETLSRIFSKMSEEGIISVDGKRIRILNNDLLLEKL